MYICTHIHKYAEIYSFEQANKESNKNVYTCIYTYINKHAYMYILN